MNSQDNGCLLFTTSDTLRIFFDWVLRCPIATTDQQLLVPAWQFGREWEIPVFQSAAMRRLVDEFHRRYVDEFAMYQAYKAENPEDIIGDKLLRKAFILQLASDNQDGAIWNEKEFLASGLDKCIDFYKDFTHTVCLAPDDGNYTSWKHGAHIEELLVDESHQ